MTSHFLSALTLGLAFCTALTRPAPGAPSTFHNDEFSVPLEDQKTLALIDAGTGQIRLLSFEAGPAGVLTGPFQSHLPGTTGVAGGIYDGKGVEHLALSSPGENTVRLLRMTGSEPDQLELPIPQPGPAAAIPLHEGEASTSLLVHSILADQGHGLSLLDDPFSSPNQIDEDLPLSFSRSLQSHQSLEGDRKGLIITKGELKLIEFNSGNISQTDITETLDEGRIATEVIGDDGRHCALVYLPGSDVVQIVTLPEGGFSSASIQVEFEDTIAAITPIPNSEGALILSADGVTAYEVIVQEGVNLKIVSTLTAPPGLKMNHLALIPDIGLIALQGPGTGGSSDRFLRYARNGNSWTPANGSALPALISGADDFATLFWFRGSPFADPTSQLLKLETQPQWTRKTSDIPLPPTIELSAFSNSALGLEVTGTTPTSRPAGSSHLLTNQISNDLSLSALDSTQALRRPGLAIDPPSGSYQNPVQLDASFDPETVAVFMRRDLPGSSWTPFSPLTISYPSTYLFYARDLNSQVSGPILTRSFQFPGLDPNSIDTDRDGVPDYVELANGLDPAGGADSDGDFQSDLEELLSGTDPNDSDSKNENALNREPPFIGEGFAIIAQAFDDTSTPGEAAPATGEPLEGGTSLTLHDFHGDLLASGLVETFSSFQLFEQGIPFSFADTTGAFLKVNSPVPESDWVVASTPTRWRYQAAIDDTLNGQEIIRVMARPINDLPAITHTPGGTDLDDDAADWVNAARDAYIGHEAYSEITRLDPIDLIISALAEEAIYQMLTEIEADPPVREKFTLFPFREADLAREPFTEAMKEALRREGFDFPAVITTIEAQVRASATLAQTARDLVALYRAQENANPFLRAPLDALRDLFATGTVTDPRGDGRTNPYQALINTTLTPALNEMEAILTLLDALVRPTATYTITVENPLPVTNGIQYRITSAEEPADLNQLLRATDQNGENFAFDQGLGLSTGTTFVVTGFADAPAPAGFVGLEVTAITGATIFVASESDTDGDLLDDQWEELFFGALDQIGAFDPHPGTGHSYLEYQLTGEDPRAGTLTGLPLSLIPTNVSLTETPDGLAYLLAFDFPSDFISFFQFKLEVTEGLQVYTTSAESDELTQISPNRFAFRTLAADTDKDAAFWRIAMSIASP